MKVIKGRYNGSTVELAEPVPVDHEVEVTVQFPEETHAGNGTPAERNWHVTEPGGRIAVPGVSGSEEVPRQRGREVIPAPGLPPIPTPEEWQQRMKVLESILDEWLADESGYDEETWPELKAALEQNRAESGEFRKPFRE